MLTLCSSRRPALNKLISQIYTDHTTCKCRMTPLLPLVLGQSLLTHGCITEKQQRCIASAARVTSAGSSPHLSRWCKCVSNGLIFRWELTANHSSDHKLFSNRHSIYKIVKITPQLQSLFLYFIRQFQHSVYRQARIFSSVKRRNSSSKAEG